MAQKFIQSQKFTLAGSGCTATATSIILSSFTTPDGTNITSTDLGTTNYGTLEPSTAREEIISFTGVTQNANGTATLTGVTRGLKFVSDYTADASLRKSHAGGTIFVLSNNPQVYQDLLSASNDETITGTYTFTSTAQPRYDTSPTFGAGSETYLVDKNYADNLAIAGCSNASTTQKGIVEESTYSEQIAGTDTGTTGARLFMIPSAVAGNIQNCAYNYKADAEASDAYAITLTPPISSYAEGQKFWFKANTANTGAATLNVSALGAKTIKKNFNQDLENGDIAAGSIVSVIYDGTNFQMLNQQATMPTTALLTESATFFGATDISGAEAETLTDGSDADSLHKHDVLDAGAMFCGASQAALAKTYWNFSIPWLLSNDVPGGNNFWTTTNVSVPTSACPQYFSYSPTVPANNSVITRKGVWVGSTGAEIQFSGTKKVFVEFGLVASGVTNDYGFGLANSGAPFYAYNDQTVDSVCFVFRSGDGKLYAHTASAGVGYTNTEITGVTLSNVNTFRIDFSPGADAKFYVNGVLKATNITNLPSGNNVIYFGCGGAADVATPTWISEPYFAVEK